MWVCHVNLSEAEAAVVTTISSNMNQQKFKENVYSEEKTSTKTKALTRRAIAILTN